MTWKLTESTRKIAGAASRASAAVVAVTKALVSPRQQTQLAGMPFQWRMSGDADLAERVRVDLSSIPCAQKIEVQAECGRVSLRGSVSSQERDAAIEIVRGVDGVRFVEDLLEVR
jgi:osmotically-inducible protein OsmY